MTPTSQIHVLTNNSLLLDAGQANQGDVLQIQKKFWALAAHLQHTNEFTDIVPGMNSLTLYLKFAADLDKWQSALAQLWEDIEATSFKGTHHNIKTNYQGEDLNYVAKTNNLTPAQVIELHSQATYHVLFLGFQPGFAYLHGLDSRLYIPRRDIPRTKVPKGAIALGAKQTAIYPAESPGGWYIIGHTDTKLFDSTQPNPCLFKPGDTLTFININAEQGE